ncbi:MAG: hypothetical protein IJ088_09885 [Clostridia bacterium]|nr:hypothetical protein [Clostridia bacterium]
MYLDRYTQEQLGTIIQNIAPNGLLEQAEFMNADLTDPLVLRRFRCHMGGLSDYFTRYREVLSKFLWYSRKNHTKEEVIDLIGDCFDLNHYEAKLDADGHW